MWAVNPEEAKRLVLKYAEKSKVNVTWLADQIGHSKQAVHQWITGAFQPRNPDVWVQMANALGIMPSVSYEIIHTARELALSVLVKSDDPDLKSEAAMLIREISKNYSEKT